MNKDVYSNSELTELKNRINKEMLRRGSYKWWGPLSQPKVGEDTRSPDSIPHDKTSIPVTDQTYTINNPSIGSIAPTRNIIYPNQGENPAGQNPDGQTPTTSAARFDLDEIKNFLVGISKIRDINLFYSQDEQEFLAFRDLGDVRKLVSEIESDRLNKPTTHPFKVDPNAPDRITVIKDGKTWTEPNPNKNIPYQKIGDKYYMPSGEMDGEEGIPSETNYYDDYGAKPGNGNYHSLNPYVSARVDRTGYDFDNDRNKIPVGRMEGGKSSSRFGMTPRNPRQGDSYQPRVAYQGVPSTCNNACSGLCFRAGTLIETINGPVPIESIRIGDLVLTQSGQYHKVYSIFRRTPKYDELIKLNIVGIPSIFTTKKHPFWTRRFIGRKHTGNGYPQIYSEPEWVDAKDLKPRDKVCLLSRNPGSTSVDHGVAYMVGRWLGDGWRTDEFDRHIGRYFTRFQICCGKHEIYDFEKKLEECKIHYTKREYRTTYSFRISRNHIGANKELGPEFNNVALLNIISKCGKGAVGKLIPQEIFEWDEDSIRTLIQGYIDADGHDTGRVTMITSVSKKLIYGISILMRMVGIVPSWTHKRLKYHTGYIEGRKVNMRDRFIMTILNDPPTRNYSFIDESGNTWTTVRTSEYENLEEYDVYNLSVEEDPTYYADGVLVHNCSLTCDSQCGESCTTTCFGRCGNACVSTCGNVCTGCSSLCYTSCQSKCENNSGMACVKAGATTLSIAARGGKDGTPAYNEMKVGAPYACTQCSFSCQFYPNKKTTCWDNGCMGMCFTSCMHSCSTSCFGGCIDNPSENKGDFKTGIGRGCSSGCTVNCVGICRGTCVGTCSSGCWNSCIQSCKDNCEWECSTSCGSGCMQGCMSGCKDQCTSCENVCTSASGAKTTCNNGCVASCMHGCDKNCIANSCTAMCGSEGTNACDANCRMTCMSSSCTAQCSEQCASYCTSCVNGCDMACGACFKAGTLIETINGPVPIEEIQIGDLVLTQSGKYHKVYNTMKRSPGIKDLLVVKGVGTFDIYTTIDHPFWVKKYSKLGRRDKEFGTSQIYDDPTWVEAKDISSRDKLCLYTPPIGHVSVNPGIAYMVGRWLGDGCRTDSISNINNKAYPRFTICCGKHERVDFERKLRQAAIYTTRHEGETTFVYRIPGKLTKHTADYNNYELVELLKKCGKTAIGKYIPQEVYNWDEPSLSYLIQGYIDADGHISRLTSQFMMTSINKKLLYQFATLLRMLDRNPSCTERKLLSDIGYIIGRKVHIHKSYMIRSQYDEYTRFYSFHDHSKNITWATFRSKHSPSEKYDVYNLSVEEDPTYYADGVLVHNCSSLCNTGCEAACNITCTAHCQHSCDLNCVKSCTEACGGCSNLCTSCVGMCIGECSVKCTNNCSLCANNCGHWCDTKCSQNCFANCDNSCMQTCTNSCIGTVTSNTKQSLAGPERPPTAHGYKTPHPSNREEERESFKIIHDIDQITTDRIIRDWKERLKKKSPYSTVPNTKICIKVKSNDNIKIIFTDCDPVPYNIYYSTVTGGVFNINEKTGTILINHKALEEWAKSGYKKVVKNVNQKDGEDVSIVAVVLHCKDTNLTINDVSYLRPLGYDFYTPYHTRNGDIICILQYLINYMEYDKNKHPDDQHITYPKRL